MILFSWNHYPPLLWRVSVLLSVGATITPITDSNINSTVKADQTAKRPATVHLSHNETEENSGPTYKSAEVTATPHITVAPTVITNTQVQLHHTPAVSVSKITASDQFAHSGNMTEMVQSTQDQLHQQFPTTSIAITPLETTSIALPTTTAVETMSLTTETSAGSAKATSLSQGRSTMGTNTFEGFFTVSPDSSPEVPSLIHKLSSPAVSDVSSAMVNATTGSLPMLNHTSFFPERRTEMPTTTTSNTIPPPTHKPISAKTTYISKLALPDATKLQSSAESLLTNASTSKTTASNHSGGILNPVSPRKWLVPSSESVSPVTKTTEVETCSVQSIVKQCLITVVALAVLATIFMVSTIILCTKLSMRKYLIKKPQQVTEMMCISALLPERNYNCARQYNPVCNGVLVIPSGEGSDDDGGGNHTLRSFFPENDHFV